MSEKNPTYRIFVASTKPDLIQHREYVKEAISTQNHVPKGMEDFPALDMKSLEECYHEIDNCHAFVLIIGCRYGNIVPELGISFTEAEYNRATEIGLKRFVYIASQHQFELELVDFENHNKLSQFKERLLRAHTIKQFRDAEHLRSEFNAGFSRMIEALSHDLAPTDLDLTNSSQVEADVINQSNSIADLSSDIKPMLAEKSYIKLDRIPYRPLRHINRYVFMSGPFTIRMAIEHNSRMCLCEPRSAVQLDVMLHAVWDLPNAGGYDPECSLQQEIIICADGEVAEIIDNRMQPGGVLDNDVIMQYVNFEELEPRSYYNDLEEVNNMVIVRKYYFKVAMV